MKQKRALINKSTSYQLKKKVPLVSPSPHAKAVG